MMKRAFLFFAAACFGFSTISNAAPVPVRAPETYFPEVYQYILYRASTVITKANYAPISARGEIRRGKVSEGKWADFSVDMEMSMLVDRPGQDLVTRRCTGSVMVRKYNRNDSIPVDFIQLAANQQEVVVLELNRLRCP